MAIDKGDKIYKNELPINSIGKSVMGNANN